MQQVRVEEQRVARLHLDVHEREVFGPLEHLLDALAVGAGLVAGEDVVDPAAVVRVPE